MPAQHRRNMGMARRPRASALPKPGITGWAYPRGPFGATGFPGSTPAALKTKQQGPDGRKDPSFRGRPRRVASEQMEDWTGPELVNNDARDVPRPQTPYGQVRFRPGAAPDPRNTVIAPSGLPRNPPARRKALTTGPEQRMSPVFDVPGEIKTIRNDRAQRWKAIPGNLHAYRPAPNPGKTGATADGISQYHPTQPVRGRPDGKPIPGQPAMVIVPNRLLIGLDAETSDYYAMNRKPAFTRGGTPAPYPPWYRGDAHIRGGRLTGQRYFGKLSEQQEIGRDSDAYGIRRRRGPNHRPVTFTRPAPWTANYYDVAPEQGTQSPDMIRRSPGPPGSKARGAKKPARGGGLLGGLTGTPAPATPTRRARTTSTRHVRRG